MHPLYRLQHHLHPLGKRNWGNVLAYEPHDKIPLDLIIGVHISCLGHDEHLKRGKEIKNKVTWNWNKFKIISSTDNIIHKFAFQRVISRIIVNEKNLLCDIPNTIERTIVYFIPLKKILLNRRVIVDRCIQWKQL